MLPVDFDFTFLLELSRRLFYSIPVEEVRPFYS
jgi:hypothetical protein